MLDLTTRRPGEVTRAQRAFAARLDRTDAFGHIKLKRELAAGNPYALAKLGRRGLIYFDGDIRRAATISSG